MDCELGKSDGRGGTEADPGALSGLEVRGSLILVKYKGHEECRLLIESASLAGVPANNRVPMWGKWCKHTCDSRHKRIEETSEKNLDVILFFSETIITCKYDASC